MQKEWQQITRLQTRERLLRQHELNISLEQKSGIVKDYKPIVLVDSVVTSKRN